VRRRSASSAAAGDGRIAGPATAAQIDDAVTHGWADVSAPVNLFESDDPDLAADVEKQTVAALSAGRHVVVHTTRGSGDPRCTAAGPVDPRHVGGQLGTLARAIAAAGLTRDVAELGGDTSSHTLTAMRVRNCALVRR
jgi:uncharacterized protein YgbK (DUF1537 family)